MLGPAKELLAQPPEGRLWAADLPDVEGCSQKELNKLLDGAVGRLLTSQGKAFGRPFRCCMWQDLAEQDTFSLLFAVLQAWPRQLLGHV